MKYTTLLSLALFVCSSASSQTFLSSKVTAAVAIKTLDSANQKQWSKAALSLIAGDQLKPPHSLGKSFRDMFFNTGYNLNIINQIDYLTSSDDFYLYETEQVWDMKQDVSGKQCKVVCPKSTTILHMNFNLRHPNRKNSLSFINNKSEYRGIPEVPDPTYNYCIGHSFTTNTLRYLAIFDPNNEKNTIDQSIPVQSVQFKKIIEERLEKMFFKNIPQVIPFLKNIRELSENFEEKMKYYVAFNWFEYGVSFQNAYNAYDNKQEFTKKKITSLLSKIKQMIVTGQPPILMINPWNNKIGHALIVHSIEEVDGVIKVLLDDSNNSVINDVSQSLLEFKPDPEDLNYYLASYSSFEADYDLLDKGLLSPWRIEKSKRLKDRVGRIETMDSVELFYGRAIESLHNYCVKESGCIN